MSVKLKTVLLFFANFLFGVSFVLVIFAFFLFKYVDKIEINDLNNSCKSFDLILDESSKSIKKTVLDWSHWDDTYNFMNGKNQDDYIENNFNYNALEQLDLNFMFFTNKQGKVTNIVVKDLDNSTRNKIVQEICNKGNAIKFKNNDDSHSGVLAAGGKIFMIVSSPITTSNEKGQSNGALIMGRYIDKNSINYINSIIGTKVKLSHVENSNKMPSNRIEEESHNIIKYNLVKDINGEMSIASSVSMDRYQYNLAKFYLKIIIGLFSLALLINIITTLYVLDKHILNRLKCLNNFIDEISRTKDISKHIYIGGNDEITNIANSTNNMLQELEGAQRNILKLSYSDKLTGLRNRVYMEKRFQEIDKNANFNYSIILGDVNGLKLVNDTFGHKEGDRLISTIGTMIKNTCSEDDVIARWGGDEFIILTVNKERKYSENLIHSIKSQCEKITEFEFKISIALGSAEKREGANAEAVMNLAEERMYRGKLTEVKSSRNATIVSLEKTLYEKSRETEQHTRRVKELSIKIGKEINLPQDKLNELELLSLLHDIGKIGIPEYILSKPSKLTAEEWEMMKQHTEIGYRIAKTTPGLKHVAYEILCHHERFDGTGYPQGLKAEDIPILSRIINVVDSFDVMTHERVYKKAFTIEYAVEELKHCSGSQFDPDIVEKFIYILENERINNAEGTV